ncbi:peptide deformylase [Firmicutes bacterium M10-2]|nr:peptide deformylase [Firmicutes bacterium M10-2]
MSIRQIIHDETILSSPSRKATKADQHIGNDLLDTLQAHSKTCLGMAANMIGELKNIIAINDQGNYLLMYNPKIVKKTMPYQTEESCLSVYGVHPCVRYEMITVEYKDERFKPKKQTFYGLSAQIIQHEIDHLYGILI